MLTKQHPCRLGYLVSQYPTLSHTFIFREILGLRQLGIEVGVASVLKPDRSASALSKAELKEFEACYYVRPDFINWPFLHLKAVAANPSGYLSALLMAIRCSHANLIQLMRNLQSFAEAAPIGEWMRSSQYTYLHTHFASFTALMVSKIFGFRFSVTFHGPDEFTEPTTGSLKEKVEQATLVIAISQYGKSQIMRFSHTLDWEKIRVVRLGINHQDFPFLATHQPTDTFNIISVGRLAKVKAHALLLRAYAIVRKQYPGTTLTIVGAGPELEALENLAHELTIPVRFTGGLPNSEVRALVRESHCFALASFAEGIPVVLMEAMALGVPCIATRVMGIPELIEHDHEGLLVNPGDELAIASAILRLIGDPGLGSRLSISARKKIIGFYNLDSNLEELASHFKDEGLHSWE